MKSIVALSKQSNVLAYADDLILSLRRHLGVVPPKAAAAFDVLAATYAGSRTMVDTESVVRDALPPVRRESGLDLVPAKRRGARAWLPSTHGGVPDVARLATVRGDFAIWFPDFDHKRWVRLCGEIEPDLVDQLLRAEGAPVSGRDIEAFRGCLRTWTKVVWAVNSLAPGGAADALIETYGEPARRPGQKRKPDSKDERPDGRSFYIRHNRWWIEPEIVIESLDGAEAALLARFGLPGRAKRPGEGSR